MTPSLQVVGHTTDTTTRILTAFAAPAGGVARVAYESGGVVSARDVTLIDAAPYSRAVFDLADLAPSGAVRYATAAAATADDLPPPEALVASPHARVVRLLPRRGTRPLRIGLVSCNDIGNSRIPAASRGLLWRALRQEVDAGRVDLLIHAGDQIYGDEDPRGWTEEEGRTSAYRRHYVKTWSHPDVAAVLGSCPSMMMWDDHEIYDGWGSNDADTMEAARTRYAAAETAFREFQGALNPPGFDADSNAWSFTWNQVGVIALDGRKLRSWKDGVILGEAQMQALARTLSACDDLKHLFVVVGTPPVFVKAMAAERLAELVMRSEVDDLRDGWTSSRNRAECRRFLMNLLAFASRPMRTQVTILAGDIHVGTLGQIDTKLVFEGGRRPRMYQVTSSGIARPAPSGIEALALRAVARGGSIRLFDDDIVGSLRPIHGSPRSYVLEQRNFALLKMEDATGTTWDVNGNVWVEFFAEIDGGVERLEQLLPRIDS